MLKRMVRGCWLLSDLDGTLIPTPHKANGQYVPLDRSCCFEPVRRWLQGGGSLCVITTADKRVFDQVFTPLRPFLKSAKEAPNGEGEVLLSLYTGAVLYRCVREGIVEEPSYADPTLPVGTSTCFNAATCSKLVDVVSEIFLRFATDVIHQRGPLGSGWEQQLSRRYQVMWHSLLKFLNRRLHERKAYLEDLSRERKPKSDATFGHLDHLIRSGRYPDWMEGYLSIQRQMFVNVGIIRRETLRSKTELDALFARGAPKGTLTEDEDPSAAMAADGNKSPPPAAGATDRFAQLIVVGLPLRHFHHYFDPHMRTFADLGVNAIGQPNSVVFSCKATSKGTAVNYLDKSLVLPGETHPGFRGKIDLRRSLGLGDNPQSADRELAVFQHLPFISFERSSQRERRHELIDATLAGGGSPAELLDDRVMDNIRYVGNEEVGCSQFLQRLMAITNRHSEHVGADREISPEEFQSSAFEAAGDVRHLGPRTSNL